MVAFDRAYSHRGSRGNGSKGGLCSCKKAGQTITAAGKKFTCVKSGKKLVWSKGVVVPAAAKANTYCNAKP
jgi:hypothetical protein